RGRESSSPGDREDLSRRRRPAHRSRDEHQAPDGHRIVPRYPSSPRPADARSAHPHQRPHQEGPAPRDRRQEEGDQVMAIGKKTKRVVEAEGVAHIAATFNNTTITITDAHGNTVAWGSSAGRGDDGCRGTSRCPSGA